MADKKLSALPAGGPITNVDLFYSDQAGVSVSQTGLALASFISGGSITVNATPIIGGTDKHVAFDNTGTFGEAANFTIESGNPNVTAAGTYRYDGQEFLRGDVGGFDSWYAGNSGTGATGFANTTFGWNALSFGPNTGAFNTAMGFAAMQSNTSGQNNVAIGAAALFTNSTGIDNTCLGNSAGTTITTGSSNIVIGSACEPAAAASTGQLSIGNYIYGTGLTGTGATISTGKIGIGIKAPAVELDVSGSINVLAGKTYQYDNVQAYAAQTALDNYFLGPTGNFTATGTNNSAFGLNCLGSLTSGVGNSAEGINALFNLTSGGANVAIGTAALSTLSLGSGNVAIGNNALRNNEGSNNFAMGSAAMQTATACSDNVAIGQQALNGATIAGSNVAIGKQALVSSNTAGNNVAIGRASGFNLLTGGSNTLLGDATGSGALFTGTRNIMIGAGIDAPADANGQINIGCAIFGTGCTTTGSASGGGEKIGILNNAPAVELDVSGSINVLATKAYQYDNTNVITADFPNSNVYFGPSGNLTTSGTSNIAVGINCLTALTTGGANNGQGHDALKLNSTGKGNSADGFKALENNTIGDNNFALGSQALQTNIDGSGNVGIGFQALQANDHGGGNVAIGATALGSQSTASNNVAVGRLSGLNITTGGRNTLLGDSAGQNNVTTQLYSIVLGYQNDVLTAGVNGQINIGCAIFGTGCVTQGTTSGGGEKIGILNNAPAVELDVAGSIKTAVTLVAGLPAPGNRGARRFVSDALGPAFGAPVVGLGGVPVPVYDDGAQWVVG